MNQRVGNLCPRSPKVLAGKENFLEEKNIPLAEEEKEKEKRRRKKQKKKKKRGRGHDSSKVKNILRKTEE